MPKASSRPSTVDLSVIVTAHAESILIHRTLASVRRALAELSNAYTYEIILHIDNPTPETLAYTQAHRATALKDVRVFQNAFKDLGASRNFAIGEAKGTYIATIDGDDIMSKQWLRAALGFLTQQTEPTVAHSEYTVEFEGANSLVVKHGDIDHDTDTLLSVYGNRWNSVIVAPRALLLEEPYTANSTGFGYEDWHLNCRLIARGVHNKLIPQTAIFVRRKKDNSEWLRQIQSMAILRANPLLAFDAVRKIKNVFADALPAQAAADTPRPTSKRLKSLAARTIRKNQLIHKTARHLRAHMQSAAAPSPHKLAPWLMTEWRELQAIDKNIFPSKHIVDTLGIYDTISPDHKKCGAVYKAAIDHMQYDTYDYAFFVPWLIKGGADKYAIDYANTIADLNPDKRVLVIATLPVPSVQADKLNTNVSFLDFGNITADCTPDIKHRVLGHIVENAGITHLHVINSELGYDFVRLHKTYLQATNRKIVVTSFSQSVDPEGRIFGYSHTHVPGVYDIASLITSDNQAVLDMWQDEYGFDSAKLILHHQPIHLPTKADKREPQHAPLRVLWGARVAPEKQPELIRTIGALLPKDIVIDVFGVIEAGNEQAVNDLPPNVHYKGTFAGLNNLPLRNYDVFLYTSLFDGMPNTLLEAAMHKLPIVSSAVGGIPEFVINQRTGLLVQDIHNPQAYADSLLQLAQDPALGPKLAEGAYNTLRTSFAPDTYRQAVQYMLDRLGY